MTNAKPEADADHTALRQSPRWLDAIPTALVWRYLCHSLMLGLAMLNEMRAAPNLPDTVLDIVPYTKWIADNNYTLWLAAYVPIALLLWRADRARFVHFLYGVLIVIPAFRFHVRFLQLSMIWASLAMKMVGTPKRSRSLKEL